MQLKEFYKQLAKNCKKSSQLYSNWYDKSSKKLFWLNSDRKISCFVFMEKKIFMIKLIEELNFYVIHSKVVVRLHSCLSTGISRNIRKTTRKKTKWSSSFFSFSGTARRGSFIKRSLIQDIFPITYANKLYHWSFPYPSFHSSWYTQITCFRYFYTC